MLTSHHCQELLSRAHIQALAAIARLNIEFRSSYGMEFDYGVDGSFRPIETFMGELVDSGCALDFQLKSSIDWTISNTYVLYDIKAKAYNKLVAPRSRAAPYILVLLCLPRQLSDAVTLSPTEMLMKHCCYWMRVSGPPTTNVESVRIKIPTANRLTPETLSEILSRVQKGDAL